MRRVICALVVTIAAVWFVPSALASVTPSVTLKPPSVTAGSTGSLEVDIKFTDSGSDTPKDLALALPAGLLANASIDGGACLSASTPTSACQVGTGTVSASSTALVPVPLPPIPVTFDLVAPPSAGDLAGLAIVVGEVAGLPTGMQLGNTGDVVFDSSGDRAGAGLDIFFTNVPKSLTLGGLSTPVQITEINSTFDGLRMPTGCPSPPANFVVGSDSYADSTEQSASAPLTVTGCSDLAFSPGFALTAAKDAADAGVAVTTDITQSANEATPRTVALSFPSSVLTPNAAAVVSGGILCANLSSGTCKPIGTASAISPLYPSTLNGQAYLTGSLSAPAIDLVFPSPFALTLVGNVNLATNTTTFDNLPDIPLSDLKVSLAGGPNAVFTTKCSPSSGTATATLTSQNGDKMVSPTSAFTLSPCSASGTVTGGGSAKKGPKSARPKLSSGSASGLTKGKPAVSFKVAVSRSAAKLLAISVRLPNGLSFNRGRVHAHAVTGLTLNGNGVKAAALKRGNLVLAFKRAVWSLNVKLGPKLLKESGRLKKTANAKRHRLSSLKVTVGTDDANGETFAVSTTIRKLHLPKAKRKHK